MKKLVCLFLLFVLAFPSLAKPAKKKLSEEVADGIDKSLSDIESAVSKIRKDLDRAGETGKKKSKEEIEKTKTALEKLRKYLNELGSNVTSEIDATVKKLNQMAPDVE